MNSEPPRIAQLTVIKRQEDSERVVKRRKELVQDHFENLNHRGDHADVADESQEGQINR